MARRIELTSPAISISFTDQLGVPMLVGSAVWDHQASGLKKYNSAILFEPAVETIRYYHKMHLVPFGEFIPLIKTIPWLALLTPYRDKIPSLSFGRDPLLLPIGGYRFAAIDLLRGHHPPGHQPLLSGPRSGRAARHAHQPDQ